MWTDTYFHFHSSACFPWLSVPKYRFVLFNSGVTKKKKKKSYEFWSAFRKVFLQFYVDFSVWNMGLLKIVLYYFHVQS